MVNYAKLFADNMNKVTKLNANVEIKKTINKINKLNETDLGTIKWVWEATIKQLLENWISSIDELKEAWIEKIEWLWLNQFSLIAIKNFLKIN